MISRQEKRRAELVRIGSRIGWRLGMGWYQLTQEISEDDSRPVQTAASYLEILRRLSNGDRWTPDPINGLLDIMRHPRRIQRWIDTGKSPGDCDEHAAYWLACLIKSGLACECWLGIIQCQDRTTGKIWGHAVALWRETEGGPILWADYDVPARTKGTWGWVDHVATKYNAIPLFAGTTTIHHLAGDDTLIFGRKAGKVFRQ